MNNILEARETRAAHIKRLMQEYPNQSVVILKANVVGQDKNPRHMRFICAFFYDMMVRTFGGKIRVMGKVESADGNYCYFVINENGRLVKARTIDIEEYNKLGRLIDLDVYDKKSIGREELQCEMRTCLICDKYAHICVRNRTHSEEEIHAKIQSIIHDFLIEYITNITIQAIYSELELYPKAGLVSHRDAGCHTDMDYETFIQSTFAIHRDIEDYVAAGCADSISPQLLQQIGTRAEQHMLETTGGINTQKGLIFLLGVFLPALTKAILTNQDEAFVIQEIKQIARTIVGDYYEALTENNKHTNGDDVYLTYGIKGIRAQALDGLKMIFDIPSCIHYDDDVAHHQYLIELMHRLDDTTIIHKTDLHTLRQVQDDMYRILHQGGYEQHKTEFQRLSDQYKKAGISPGGSADMLVIKIIYEDVKHLLRQF